MSNKLDKPVLVLNRFYMAIDITTARRALVLMYVNHAETVEVSGGKYDSFDFERWLEHSENAPADSVIQTVSLRIAVPFIIRLYSCSRMPRRKVPLTRKNILIRDGYRCQYCGRTLPPSHLSLDHVIPVSKGGKQTWTNVVCACFDCNGRKGRHSPQEAGMTLRSRPRTPDFTQAIRSKLPPDKPDIWKRFLS